ncbi:putative gamma-glutamylcyclotransferase CG2811 [Episyrphus balteatus]|uniref:putative gamma-glutamylcyclotransferase CG2811 n=1 Tax=Episyrphus balteatus TaxID=286459 RepID=UPI002485F979|nr:putative gamma-glutamylcyclotransferase CG2811 [Episyrphus balteatus]
MSTSVKNEFEVRIDWTDKKKMSASKVIRVFVYGTLKKNEPNHHWLTTPSNGVSKFISCGQTVEKFPLVIGTRYNIPFLLDKKGTGNNICGEIYEVDESMFSKLDELEDYPKHYDREIQEIKASDGSIIPCWLYLIRNFPEVLLTRKFLTSYTDSEEQQYCESDSEEMSRDEMLSDMTINYEK